MIPKSGSEPAKPNFERECDWWESSKFEGWRHHNTGAEAAQGPIGLGMLGLGRTVETLNLVVPPPWPLPNRCAWKGDKWGRLRCAIANDDRL